ncbi:LOB domain-containing protein 36 [Prosopis cineraria]|uniref:LOB domain-containing protein 36 n=1 Tax=Prosopis cineraria TaxID=364024 RepID=UPI0024100591|nr:LOB domain-containing protein 36 [Prosopis cineraria]XP_054810511.1 LOB domain-containing protein 36 [Prosopis cineraria]
MSSSKTPCAACKLQRRKCTQECVFAPYFPPDNPRKFSTVHQVFGASNVSKLLTELNVAHREEAVRSLAYEAEARLRDPVYGCVGLISVLQQRLKHVQSEVDKAKKELATYIGPQALQPMVPVLDPHHGVIPLHPHHQGNVYGPTVFPNNNNMLPQSMASRGGQLVIREPQQQQQQRAEQQMLGTQLTTDMDVRQVQEFFGIYDQQQQQPPPPQQQDFMRYGGGGGIEMGSVSGSGFSQAPEMSPSLALNTYDNAYHSMQLQQAQGGDHPQQQNQQHHHHTPRHHPQEFLPPQHQNQHQHHQPLHNQLQEQLLLSPQQQQPQQQLQEQMLLPQQPHHQQNQCHHQQPSHHQVQEQLFLPPQQDQHHPHPPQHHQLQEQLLLPPQQQQHQEQSEGLDGRSVGPSS